MKTERIDWLAGNPFYTKRFAWHVGQRCRGASISDVAKEFKLDWQTVKTLDKQYMAEQLKRAGQPGPRAIGIDEISIRKGHTYRIVVSDLIRKWPIWFGGEDRFLLLVFTLFSLWTSRRAVRCGSTSALNDARAAAS